MDTELKIAIGERLKSSPALFDILNKEYPVVYGWNPEIDALESLPYIRFYSIDENSDSAFSSPEDKFELRLQVDANSASESINSQVMNHILSLLAIPHKGEPIETESYRVDISVRRSVVQLEVPIRDKETDSRVKVASSDWTLKVIRKT